MSPDQLLLLPLWFAVFLLSLTCHEAAHAWAAYRGGDDTAYLGGQVSLNPIPHVQREPFGTILVPMLSYFWMGFMMGWASAPYDPHWADRYPRRAAAMAAAGPAANLILALIAFAVLKIGLGAGLWGAAPGELFSADRLVMPLQQEAGALEGLGRFCSVLLFLNVLLFLFNLIPLPPLDGAAVAAGLWPTARNWLERLRASGVGGLLGLVVAIMAIRRIFPPLFHGVLDLLFLGL